MIGLMQVVDNLLCNLVRRLQNNTNYDQKSINRGYSLLLEIVALSHLQVHALTASVSDPLDQQVCRTREALGGLSTC